MKVYIFIPNSPESTLIVKSMPIQQASWELARKHLRAEYKTKFVWFEGEAPPEVVVKLMSIELQLKGIEDGLGRGDSFDPDQESRGED